MSGTPSDPPDMSRVNPRFRDSSKLRALLVVKQEQTTSRHTRILPPEKY